MGLQKLKRGFLLLMAATTLIMVGCAEEKKSAPKPVVEDPVDATSGDYVNPGSSESEKPSEYWSKGSTVTLVIEGDSDYEKAELLSSYTGRTMYNPKDIQLNVNLVQRSNGGYGGRIAVGYYDDGAYREGVFVNGDESSFPNTSKEKAAQYNRFFNHDGEEVFHGFFQDFQGGVVLVVDGVEAIGVGDGVAPTKAKGSVWFKNFKKDYPSYIPPTSCWFVIDTPYDCRAWVNGKSVDTYRSVNPDNGYIKLGTFSGLDLTKGFSL